MNRYPTWVNVLVLVICVAGVILALPNFLGDDPALHVSRADGSAVQPETVAQTEFELGKANIAYLSAEKEENIALIRFPAVESQLRATDVIRDAFPDHGNALTHPPSTRP